MPTESISVGTTPILVARLSVQGDPYQFLDIIIQNLSGNNVYIGSSQSMTATSGLKLVAATGVYTNDKRQDEVWLIADGAGSDVRVDYATYRQFDRLRNAPL